MIHLDTKSAVDALQHFKHFLTNAFGVTTAPSGTVSRTVAMGDILSLGVFILIILVVLLQQ